MRAGQARSSRAKPMRRAASYTTVAAHRCLWQATSCYSCCTMSMASYTTAAAQNYGHSHLANRPTLRNLAKCPAHQTTSKPGKCPLPQNLESDLYLKTWKVTCSQNLESSQNLNLAKPQFKQCIQQKSFSSNCNEVQFRVDIGYPQ